MIVGEHALLCTHTHIYYIQYLLYFIFNLILLLIFPFVFFSLSSIIGGVIGFLPLMGWRGDTKGGSVCWFILISPPPLIILTALIAFIPMCIVVVLYSIILYHAIRKVIQLNRATQNTDGAQDGRLRMFRGGGGSTMVLDQPSTNASQVSLNVINQRNGTRNGTSEMVTFSHDTVLGAIPEPEEPMEPKSRFARFFRR